MISIKDAVLAKFLNGSQLYQEIERTPGAIFNEYPFDVLLQLEDFLKDPPTFGTWVYVFYKVFNSQTNTVRIEKTRFYLA